MILGVAAAAEQAAQLLRALILARILSPHDFGLMGMAIVVVFTAEALSQTGLNRALVQKRGDPHEDLDTVWSLSGLRGLLLYGILWLLAPAVARFFETPEVLPILRVAALAFPIQALVNPAFFILEREMDFVRVAWPRLAGVVCDLTFAVALSLILRNVWGMVWGFLIGKTVYVGMSYAVRPWRPALKVSWSRALDLYRYGRHVFRSSVVDCIVGQGDRALIGRMLGTDALGLYSLAARIASLPVTAGVQIVFRVAFPVFSKVQEEAGRLRGAFQRTLGLITAMVAPVTAGLWVTADELVMVLFGAQWSGMTPSFRVLCLAGAPAALYQLLRVILAAIGRPDLAAHGSYLYLLAFALPLYPAIRAWGSVGAAWCAFAGGVVAMAYLLRATLRLIGAGPRGTMRALGVPAGAALVMAGAVAMGRLSAQSWPSLGMLCAEVVGGAVVYLLALAVLDRLCGSGLAAEMGPLLRAIRWPGVRSGRPPGDLRTP